MVITKTASEACYLIKNHTCSHAGLSRTHADSSPESIIHYLLDQRQLNMLGVLYFNLLYLCPSRFAHQFSNCQKMKK